jgi:hypothetical protein
MATATHNCKQCKEDKPRNGFNKKQWKLIKDGGLCKPCWHDHLISAPPSKKQKRLDEDGEVHANKKQQIAKIESQCKKCQAMFVARTKAQRKSNECKACVKKRLVEDKLEKERQLEQEREQVKVFRIEETERRRQKAKKEYFLTYGVAYSTSYYPEFGYKTEPLLNETLLGKYQLVFYASYNDSCFMARSARGTMVLSQKQWDGKPAVFGEYTVDTRKPNGKDARYWRMYDDEPSATFIENVTDWDHTMRSGFGNSLISSDASDSMLGSGMGRKDFVLSRGRHCGPDWWSDLLTAEVDDVEEDEFCGAVIKVVEYRSALCLTTAQNTPYNAVTCNLERADELMNCYRDGCDSWIYEHLEVPTEVAFKIREFVTPPPVFYVEEGDVVLVVEESKEHECFWIKTLVFRKSD